MNSLPGKGSGSGTPYSEYSEKYNNFEFPRARVELGGKPFGEKQKKLMIGDINVELTSGFEASVSRFRIYNSFDQRAGKYEFEEAKNQAVLGALLVIYLGYLNVLEPVFVGFVAGVSFGYDGTDAPYIEITGMDAKGVMMASAYATQIKVKSYGEAVRNILQRTAYEKMKSSAIISGVSVSDTPDKKPPGNSSKASAETIEMVSESDYEFIVKAAKKFNYEFFIDRGHVLFRKAKCDTSPVTTLSHGKGLLTYNIDFSLTGIVETIEARSMDAGSGKIITSNSRYNKTLSSANKAKALIKGSKRVFIDPTINSQEQANARVASLMEEMSYRLGTAKCECIGMPELLPGKFVNIQVGSPHDTSFYITSVIHDFPSSGAFRTRIVAKADSLKEQGNNYGNI